MKSILLSLSLVLVAAPRSVDELRAVYRPGQVFTQVEDAWSAMEIGSLSMKINGEEVTGEMLEELSAEMPAGREDEHSERTTWIEEVEEGRPIRARRRYDELEKVELEGDERKEKSGVLVGRTFVLRGSADEGEDEVEAELAADDDGPAVDDVYLQNHRLVDEYDGYLPEEPVEVGDRWELDDEILRELMQFESNGPTLYEKEDEGADDFMASLMESADYSGTVEYARVEEVDGVKCALLVLSVEITVEETEVDPDDVGMEEEEGMETAVRMSCSMKAEDRLWFALDAGHAVRAEGEMEGEVEMQVEMSAEELGLEILIEVTMEITGGHELQCTVEQER